MNEQQLRKELDRFGVNYFIEWLGENGVETLQHEEYVEVYSARYRGRELRVYKRQ
jgi:hypothetical protein